MWFETRKGLLVLTGCCHSGQVNTVTHIRRISGIEGVLAIVGGLHWLNASADRLEQTMRSLPMSMPIKRPPSKKPADSDLQEGLLRAEAAIEGNRMNAFVVL